MSARATSIFYGSYVGVFLWSFTMLLALAAAVNSFADVLSTALNLLVAAIDFAFLVRCIKELP